MVYILCVGCDDVTAYFAYDFKNFVIAVLSIGIVERCIVEFLGIGIVTFFQSHDLLHQRMGKMVSEIGIICIKVSHCYRITVLFGVFLVIFDQLGHHFFKIAGNDIVGYSVDRGCGIIVD